MKAMEAALLGQGDDMPLLSLQSNLDTDFMRLCICKLDDTSFEVKVRGTATVGDLKIDIQDLFESSRTDEGFSISWTHLWRNFCLSFEDNKLIEDHLRLSSFGIKDGDQLFFERYVSHVNEEERPHSRKKGKTKLIKRRFSDGGSADDLKVVSKIDVHWTNIIKAWALYAKLWINGIKVDCRKLLLSQKPDKNIQVAGH